MLNDNRDGPDSGWLMGRVFQPHALISWSIRSFLQELLLTNHYDREPPDYQLKDDEFSTPGLDIAQRLWLSDRMNNLNSYTCESMFFVLLNE